MISWALQRFMTERARRVERAMFEPREAQDRAFDRLKRVLDGSEVARRSGFQGCRALEDCRRLPASDSESLTPLFREVFEKGAAAGELFGRTPLWGFAQTSGTLGDAKYIPITEAYLSALDRTIVRMVACQLYTGGDWSMLLRGKRVLLGSRPVCGRSPQGLPICDASGLMATRAWRSVRWLFAPRHQDHFISDWSTKAERILDQTRGREVISISGIPALFLDLAERAKAKYGVPHLDGVWPSLRQILYGAVHLSRERRDQIVRSWFAEEHPLQFFESYFATEAPLAFSFTPDDEGMALTVEENLFLFRPQDGADEQLFAHELREGASYSIQVTTPGGLVNYRLGDRIEVVSTRPLRIRVAGRESEELSMTGEKITVAQVDRALEAAGLGAPVLGEHRPVVWVEGDERPGLVWGLPDTSEAVRSDPGCGPRLDEALCRFNVLYAEALRYEKVVAPSRVCLVPGSVFVAKTRGGLGRGQHKLARLFPSREAFRAAYQWSETAP